MDIMEMMMQFNLTRQEANIYITLLREGDISGYEAAKITGISRSNAYASLASLVEKGAAYAIEGAPIKYMGLPIDEMCENRIKKLQETKKMLIKSLPEKREETEGYITIKGKDKILSKMKNMILEAQERVYISVSEKILEDVITEIKQVIRQGVKMVIIVNKEIKVDGAIIHYSEKSQQQIRLIVDSSYVLTGDMDNKENSTCLYSKKKNLVDLIKESLKNEIQLIELKE